MRSFISAAFFSAAALVVGTGMARGDGAADALVARCVRATTGAVSLQADFDVTVHTADADQVLRGSMKLKRPNCARIEISEGKGEDSVAIYSDGRRVTTFLHKEQQYVRHAADMSGGNVVREPIPEAAAFFNPDLLNRYCSMGAGLKIAGSSVIGGVACRIVTITGAPVGVALRLYIGPDGLLRGVNSSSGQGSLKQELESRMTHVKAGVELRRGVFAWSPPYGAKAYAPGSAPVGGADPAPPALLATGTRAPEFMAEELNGLKAPFPRIYQANRVTLLNFWSYFCGPCRGELPILDKMQVRLGRQGFAAVCVNIGDPPETVRALWRDSKFQMTAVVSGDAISDTYKVTGIPANYLIGRNGVILASFVGFDPDGIRKALAKAGIK